jgi:NADPH-dependent glutamate synthase beta subunit-like oxidoreductase/NAD(P)H-flavin reductase
MLALKHGLSFEDLYARDGLVKLDGAFLAFLAAVDSTLAGQLQAARATPDALSKKEESDLLIALAPHVEDFVADLFGIGGEVQALAERHNALAPLYACKRLFVQRRAVKAAAGMDFSAYDHEGEARALGGLFGQPFTGPGAELVFAANVNAWSADETANAEKLDRAARYAAWATLSPEGQAKHRGGLLFKVPKKLDFEHLVPAHVDQSHGFTCFTFTPDHLRRREGFALTDPGTDLAGALDEANYCIWCHHQGKDSCSKGLREKAKGGGLGEFKKSPFGITLAGCPLEEKISEMHEVKAQGHAIGALAMITVDNPMCAGTGHRICNDCMKSCIYQKQQPVDIPQAETRTLKDVLDLPYGFEVYGLLTRWNPLDLDRPYPKADSGRRVLVAGLGPAGFTLAHHLLNDGHVVAAIDGLKIEPLPADLSGVTPTGERVPFRPIRDVAELTERLDERTMAGFGGVAEYGITVRWNKNFLKVIRLLLERRRAFAMFGGVRFGGTLTLDQAFGLGFDHVALAMGAGRPTVLDMPNGLAHGVRTASDFLMALQLTGAAKADSIANMQIRLPVVVIGGGLTAIDTSTEALAYYPVQVEKFLARYETLVAERGEARVRAAWRPEELAIADEFLAHGRALRAERFAAAKEGRPARVIELLQSWGGSTMAYRKRLIDSPSYTLNHEEVEKALEEGIAIAEGLSPIGIEVDELGHAKAIRMARETRAEDGSWRRDGEVTLPARTILIAAGTQPNTVLAREDGSVLVDGKYFQAFDEDGEKVKPERVSKPEAVRVLVQHRPDGRTVSYFGDLHPSFAGNVVKAMGGAKQGYPVVSRMLAKVAPASDLGSYAFLDRMNGLLRARVREVNRLTPTIVEVVVEAPLTARGFQPGQFYRLQNFETLAPRVEGTTLAMEGLALTGAWTDPERGLLGTIVLEMGGSSDLCAHLQPGEPVILMGPTGAPTEIESGETVMLVGGGLGNAVLFSIGQALRAKGSKVLYFAGYKKMVDRYKVADIEAAADVIVWASDEGPGFTPGRPQDSSFVGNIVAAIKAYGEGELGTPAISLADVDRIVAIGSDRMMAAVAAARHGVLSPLLKPQHVAIGSINSPMQCMMKEICAQCLQPHKDPVTGEVTYVFSCFNQDQALDRVDWHGLNSRLGQNSVQEKLTAQWIDRCLVGLQKRPAAVA